MFHSGGGRERARKEKKRNKITKVFFREQRKSEKKARMRATTYDAVLMPKLQHRRLREDDKDPHADRGKGHGGRPVKGNLALRLFALVRTADPRSLNAQVERG